MSELDALGRTGTASMCACYDILPDYERERLLIKPSGWNQNKYDFLKDDDNPAGYANCRAHLLAFCLCGLQNEERNLITSTFALNGYTGMEYYEMQILSYIKKDPSNHVIYSLKSRHFIPRIDS